MLDSQIARGCTRPKKTSVEAVTPLNLRFRTERELSILADADNPLDPTGAR
jgi:hypothetical protein